MPETPPKAVVFDLDDTLVVEEASAEAAYLLTCELARRRYGVDPAALHATLRRTCRGMWHQAPVRAYCIEIGISSWEALWARFDGDDENLRILRDWSAGYRRDSWHRMLREHGIDDVDFALKLAETFPMHRRQLHIIYDDVRPALEYLGRTCRLGLLTNGAPDLQREKIAGAGIARYFDAILVSGDIGIGKPDRRIYEAILARLGAAAHEAVMVGNSLETDVQGAQAVGMKAIWVNRDARRRCNGIIPDSEVATLTELQHILG